jgi:hypothetical protein
MAWPGLTAIRNVLTLDDTASITTPMQLSIPPISLSPKIWVYVVTPLSSSFTRLSKNLFVILCLVFPIISLEIKRRDLNSA